MSVITVNTYEAKANLSKLLTACSHGDDVTITRGSVPIARLVAASSVPERETGFLPLNLSDESVAESLAPLSDEALPGWLKNS